MGRMKRLMKASLLLSLLAILLGVSIMLIPSMLQREETDIPVVMGESATKMPTEMESQNPVETLYGIVLYTVLPSLAAAIALFYVAKSSFSRKV